MSTTPCYLQLIYGPDVEGDPLNYTTNAVIPLTGKYRLLSKIVYGDDENQVLYHEHSLTVESIIYNETHTGPVDNVEEEVQRLRTILSTPRHQLKLHPIGLGELGTINVDDMDVKGGPFPQDITVESVASNNAIMIRWAVMFRTKEGCEGSGVPSTLLQYNVEQDMNVDDDGNMEFTLNITYQSSEPITDPQALADISITLVRRVNKSFQGMTKKKRTSLSRDQRIMSIRIVYKEIDSDSAFLPYTSNIQVTDELESSLLGSNKFAGIGFYTWRRTIGGVIRLPSRIHKGYAWYVFLLILRERFKNLRVYGKIAAVLDATPPVSQPNIEADQETNWYLLLRLKITNPIYSREMRFECTYVVVTDLNSLEASTRIFQRVNADENEATTLSDQWEAWQTSRNTNLNGRFNYTVSGTPIVYDQCTGSYSDHQIGPNSLLGLEIEGEEPSGSAGEDSSEDARDPLGLGLSPKYTWIKYENDFEIEEDTNSIPVSYLEEPSPGYYTSTDGAYSNREVAGFIYNGKTTNSLQTNPPTVIARGHSTYFVRMKGHAMRVGYKIPLPFIVTVAGKTAKRVGGKVSHKQVAAGDIPTYLAKWDILYCIEGGDIYNEDIMNSIITTGTPGMYT